MAALQLEGSRCRNSLLTKLSAEKYELVRRSLHRVRLEVPQVLYAPNRPIDYAYFPESGMISVISTMSNGDSIEVGTIGREGMSGAVALMGAESTPYRYFIQADGEAHRIEIEHLRKLVEKHQELRDLILRYETTFLTQSMQCAACNGLHTVQQRCCRWLLMARDRSDSDEISLTHEFLALMLGVRRASVSEVLGPLQEEGLVSTSRGRITIVDRVGLEKGVCECYGMIVKQHNSVLG
jgi:CRP-like cAMP-binding protein